MVIFGAVNNCPCRKNAKLESLVNDLNSAAAYFEPPTFARFAVVIMMMNHSKMDTEFIADVPIIVVL